MKDYATETDVIETADPLFYHGDVVKMSTFSRATESGYQLIVESFSWNTLKSSWMYTLVFFMSNGNDSKWNGSLAQEEVLEKELKLVSRKPRK